MKEVIILGCGPSRVECLYHCETWGVNGCYTFANKLDKLFMTDGPDVMAEDVARRHDIAKYGCTLILAHRFPEVVPAFERAGIPIEVYPIDKIVDKFKTRFFSNSIAYMLAYALYYDYEKIWFYGIDMMSNTTYIQEKGGVEFWMGVACGMGVEVVNTKGSATGKTWDGKMYGWWGQKQEEKLKERLLAPWEIIKAPAPIRPPEEEWVKVDDENWLKIPYMGTKVGK